MENNFFLDITIINNLIHFGFLYVDFLKIISIYLRTYTVLQFSAINLCATLLNHRPPLEHVIIPLGFNEISLLYFPYIVCLKKPTKIYTYVYMYNM